MKRFYAFSLAIGLGFTGITTAQLPNIGINTNSALQNRATVRVPGVSGNQAAAIRAGANLDGTRLRLNAKSRNNASLRAGGVRVSGQTNAAVEARRRAGERRPDTPGDATAQPDQVRTSQGNEVLLQTSLEFRNRLAEIEQMRDVAIQRNDVQLMQRADQLEHALRLRYRVPTQGAVQAQGQLRQQSQAAIQGRQQVQGNVQGPSQAAANGAIRGLQRFQGEAQGRFQNGADAAFRGFGEARGQGQQGADAALENSARAEAEARARGELTTSAAARASNGLRRNAESIGVEAQGQARQQFDGSVRTGRRVFNNVQGRIDNVRRTTPAAASGTFRQTQEAAGNAQFRGEAYGLFSTTGRVQGGPANGSVNQSAQGRGQIDASGRRADSPSNPAPPRDNPAPQNPAPRDNSAPQNPSPPQGNPAPQPNPSAEPVSE